MTVDLTKPFALLLAVAVVAFFVGGLVLSGEVDYTACLDLAGSRRNRTVQRYVCSPHLLGGGWREYFVFVWLWALPTLLLVPLVLRFVRKSVS